MLRSLLRLGCGLRVGAAGATPIPGPRAGSPPARSGVTRGPPVKNSVMRDDYKGSPSDGEKKQILRFIGPIDALEAKSIADNALVAAQRSGLSGLHDGPADAYRHCLWSCDMARSIGADQAKLVGDNH